MGRAEVVTVPRIFIRGSFRAVRRLPAPFQLRRCGPCSFALSSFHKTKAAVFGKILPVNQSFTLNASSDLLSLMSHFGCEKKPHTRRCAERFATGAIRVPEVSFMKAQDVTTSFLWRDLCPLQRISQIGPDNMPSTSRSKINKKTGRNCDVPCRGFFQQRFPIPLGYRVIPAPLPSPFLRHTHVLRHLLATPCFDYFAECIHAWYSGVFPQLRQGVFPQCFIWLNRGKYPR